MADGRPEARDRLAIIAGGGMLPRYVADAARARGESPYILALTNESGEDWSGFDHEVISIGNYAGIGNAFRRHGIGRAVLSGWVRRRPEWRDIHAPFKALLAVPSVVRTLLKGGVYLYPPTKKTPHGKLRLLYEANPLAMIAREAGGAATNGTTDILAIDPEIPHQRVPLVIGSKTEVEAVRALVKADA